MKLRRFEWNEDWQIIMNMLIQGSTKVINMFNYKLQWENYEL